MKKYLLSTILTLSVSLAIAAPQNKVNSTAAINANDTIVIDLSNQTLVGGKVSFPVSIISDDTIYALDFSFKFDQANFAYDTILNLSPLLQSTAYLNTSDSTVRYTSFSLDSLPKNTSLVSISMATFSAYMCAQDINTIKGFLNGDVCSVKLINCLSAGITDIDESKNTVSVYPNPANQILNVQAAQNATIVLVDVNGKVIFEPIAINKDENFQLNTRTFKNGVYFLKLYNDNFVSVRKVVVQH